MSRRSRSRVRAPAAAPRRPTRRWSPSCWRTRRSGPSTSCWSTCPQRPGEGVRADQRRGRRLHGGAPVQPHHAHLLDGGGAAAPGRDRRADPDGGRPRGADRLPAAARRPMTDPAEPGRGRRVGPRGRRQVVVVAAGLGAALLGTTPAVWVRAATWTPLSERAEVTVTGVQAAPAVSAAGLLIVASALALAMARRWGAVLAGVVVVGGAGVAVAAVLSVLADPAVPAGSASTDLSLIHISEPTRR